MLENLSGMSSTDAKELILRSSEDDLQYEIARRYRDIELQAREEADQKAKKVLI